MINGGGIDPKGANIFIIGLSHGDLDRLRGNPDQQLVLRLGNVPAEVTIILRGAENDEAMIAQLLENHPGMTIDGGATRH